ncbi:RNA polymerase sigma factor [Butyricimonas hominis]|uniref:Sigma-70 family RNA polymerase sigma factor n=1 Tax=Butyricimonas hominis TaxID=2763032 RepID=A0ABR7CW57_9BACT|nr:sigma-70 family RNA polymerase sigma factor [Butyricimonas hominis]MBC5619914.1 sigma-70 family RNA polymerase sigma factor [Butyricimonas hominis]
MQVDDKLICRFLGEHDHRGMEILFEYYYRPLVLWADTFLSDIPAAEDVVQDFLVDFWEKRAYERITSGSIRGYLFAAVRNRALKLLEKRDVLREAGGVLPVLVDESDTDWLTEEILQAVEAEIEKLPPRMREVLRAVYIDGLSYRETAEKFVISIATVKTLLVNALKRLRKVFSNFPRFFS